MSNKTFKARIIETNEIVNLVKVGNDVFLDEESKEIYNRCDFQVVEEQENQQPEFSTQRIFTPLSNFMEAMSKDTKEKHDNEIEKIILSFKANIVIEIVKKRPFMSPRRIEKRADEIVKRTLTGNE